MKRRPAPLFLCLTLCASFLTGCGDEKNAEESTPVNAIPVSVVNVRSEGVEALERSMGRIESVRAPTINSEVAGRVVRIAADRGMVVREGTVLAELDSVDLRYSAQAAAADAARLEPMVNNQQSTVNRYRSLRQEGVISQEMLDNAEAQLASLQQQLTAARSQSSLAARNLRKATITAPFAGQIEARLISEGDFLERGKAAFRLVATDRLQARLPFPEVAMAHIRPGQAVRLSLNGLDEPPFHTTLTSVSPQIDPANNAFYATAEFTNPGIWPPGASVTAEVVVASRSDALLVPQISVVRRPAGEVVYVVKDAVAEQRIVQTGVSRDGWVEIRQGITAGDQVVSDGAAYLTDKAPVAIKTTTP